MGSLSLLQGSLPNPGIEPSSPTLQADSLPAELSGKPREREGFQNYTLEGHGLKNLVATQWNRMGEGTLLSFHCGVVAVLLRGPFYGDRGQ